MGEEIRAGDFRAEMLGFWPRRREASGSFLELLDSSGERRPKDREPSPELPTRNRQQFTDEDIDILLKRISRPNSPENRIITRFLLAHRIEVDAETLELIHELGGRKVLKGDRADSLIAALSKLSPADVPRGYEIILSTLRQGHPTLSGSIQTLVSNLHDLAGRTFNLEKFPVEADVLRTAFEEQIRSWNATLAEPLEEKVKLVVERKELLQRAWVQSRQASNLLALVRHTGTDAARTLTQPLQTIFTISRSIISMLLTDAILSREDVHHHILEHGVCHSLGLDDAHHSCRLWAHDRDNPSSRELSPESLVLFLRWFTDELGLLEARVEVADDELELRFFSPHSEVRQGLDEAATEIEERIQALGYEARQLASSGEILAKDEDTEIDTEVTRVTHLDLKA